MRKEAGIVHAGLRSPEKGIIGWSPEISPNGTTDAAASGLISARCRD
jgi:hypothetical protein